MVTMPMLDGHKAPIISAGLDARDAKLVRSSEWRCKNSAGAVVVFLRRQHRCLPSQFLMRILTTFLSMRSAPSAPHQLLTLQSHFPTSFANLYADVPAVSWYRASLCAA
eukprot:scaffold7436_cov258-Pinguiococcus_pyrenoidosus.AAC.4